MQQSNSPQRKKCREPILGVGGSPAAGRRRDQSKPEPWPPAEYALPETLEEIEQGRPEWKRRAVDDSREGRLHRTAGQQARKAQQ